MSRTKPLTLNQLSQKKYNTFEFDGMWLDVFGTPEKSGMWLIYGDEKHGKTTLAIKLGEYLSNFGKVLYVSAEEGMSFTFQQAVIRSKVNLENKMYHFTEYLTFDQLSERLSKQRSHKIIILDNVTVYKDDFKNDGLYRLLEKNKNKLFIFLAHAEGKEPYLSYAKLIKKLANVIVRVEGLRAFVGGRCPGGEIHIDQNYSELYHGTNVESNEKIYK